MGLRKRYSWAVEQKELEGKGYKFNGKGECIHDPFKPKKEIPVVPKPSVTEKKVEKQKLEKQKKSFKKSMGKILNIKKPKKRGK